MNTFISSCLHSECEVISSVYDTSTLSPIGHNFVFCSSRLGVCVCLTLYAYINKSFVWAVHRSHLTTSCLSTVSLLLELLFAILGYFSVPCLSRAEVAYAIDFICIC